MPVAGVAAGVGEGEELDASGALAEDDGEGEDFEARPAEFALEPAAELRAGGGLGDSGLHMSHEPAAEARFAGFVELEGTLVDQEKPPDASGRRSWTAGGGGEGLAGLVHDFFVVQQLDAAVVNFGGTPANGFAPDFADG